MGVIKMAAQHKLMLVSADSAGSYLACLVSVGGCVWVCLTLLV